MTDAKTRQLFLTQTVAGASIQIVASTFIAPLIQPTLKAWYDWLVRTMCDWTPHAIDA